MFSQYENALAPIREIISFSVGISCNTAIAVISASTFAVSVCSGYGISISGTVQSVRFLLQMYGIMRSDLLLCLLCWCFFRNPRVFSPGTCPVRRAAFGSDERNGILFRGDMFSLTPEREVYADSSQLIQK